jgi:hypothetical protein
MGADNLLEAQIVLPSGKVVIANACKNQDLFWAVRGGGGGTFGVIMSATFKAYPSPQTTQLAVQVALINPNKTEEWYDLMAYIHSEFPRLKDAGVQGYYAIVGPPVTPVMAFAGSFNIYDQPNGTVEALFAPVLARINESGIALAQYKTVSGSSFFTVWNDTVTVEDVAGTGAMGSRLLTRNAVTADINKLARTLESIGPKSVPSPVRYHLNI